jgi:hypothetical protein
MLLETENTTNQLLATLIELTKNQTINQNANSISNTQVIVWVVTGLFGIAVMVIGFFLVRYIKGVDTRVDEQQKNIINVADKLEQRNSNLNKEINNKLDNLRIEVNAISTRLNSGDTTIHLINSDVGRLKIIADKNIDKIHEMELVQNRYKVCNER